MAEDDIEIGESVEITDIVSDTGDLVGTVVDDLVVATSTDGSIVEETVDVYDGEGNLVAEEDTVDVYDADGNLLAETTEVIVQD